MASTSTRMETMIVILLLEKKHDIDLELLMYSIYAYKLSSRVETKTFFFQFSQKAKIFVSQEVFAKMGAFLR
jgi:predicted nucleic-acid-binding protein